MNQAKKFGSKLSLRAVACAIALAAMYGTSAMAEDVGEPGELLQASISAASLENVERAFWVCDYIGTTRGVDFAPVDVCVAATEELKVRKFDGDVEAMFEWWAENKPAVHGHLASLEQEAAPQP